MACVRWAKIDVWDVSLTVRVQVMGGDSDFIDGPLA